MGEEEVFSNLILDVDDFFINFDIPRAVDKVGHFDETSLLTIDANAAMRQSIKVVAPRYDIPFDKLKAL